MKVKKLTFMAMLLAVALTIFIVELQIPALVPIPGIKLGLANIVTLLALVWLGRREALAILVMRIVLGSVFSGRMVSFLYSLSGGLLCFIVMALIIKRFDTDRLWVVSIFGAIAHNIGQVIAAILIMSTWRLAVYLPPLIISGVVTGAFTGACALLVIKRTAKIKDKYFGR